MIVGTVESWAHPSLAIAKYWGKRPGGVNIPATPSVALTLGAMTAHTTVQVISDVQSQPEEDRVVLDGHLQDARRFRPFFDTLRAAVDHRTGAECLSFSVESSNDFPTAAGLASSAAGFAALAAACVTALTGAPDMSTLSRLARVGSGSACRSIYGGFTRWNAGAEEAQQIRDETWWPDLRVVILPVTTAAKPLSSREAMNRTRDTSPFYNAWTEDAPTLAQEVEEAIANRDLERLGTAARNSYLRMFGTMLGAASPVLYWLPRSVAIIQELELMRSRGIPAWETMDAGPQVKVFTDREHAAAVADTFRNLLPVPAIISEVGAGVRVEAS